MICVFKRVVILFLLLIPACVQTHIQTDEVRHTHVDPNNNLDKTLYGATVVPDRIVLTLTEHPATSIAVTWRTNDQVQRGLVQITVAGDGPDIDADIRQLKATTEALEAELGKAYYHSAIITGLDPKTKYVYRVGNGTHWSEWNHFVTASDQAEPFSFVYFGDAQNDLKSRWSRVVREAYSDLPKAAFFLHAGDLVNVPNADHEWGQWFYAGSHIHRMIPCVATPGNHEYDRRRLSVHWQPTFTFPMNGPSGLEETCYCIDYQRVRIISLNSMQRTRQQAPWLHEQLQDNPNRWTILTFHHPIYSTAKDRDNRRLRDLWQPIFDQYRVDLVLNGHDHTYGRTGLMGYTENLPTGVMARDPNAGTVYAVSVSGPKMYDLGEKPFMVRLAEDTQLYQIITVKQEELLYEARTATGRLYDAFTLRKREGQINELINRIPDTPERRRN